MPELNMGRRAKGKKIAAILSEPKKRGDNKEENSPEGESLYYRTRIHFLKSYTAGDFFSEEEMKNSTGATCGRVLQGVGKKKRGRELGAGLLGGGGCFHSPLTFSLSK